MNMNKMGKFLSFMNIVKSQKIFFICIFLFCVNFVFGEDFTWISTAVDSDWTNVNNWTVEVAGNPTVPLNYPQFGDSVHVTKQTEGTNYPLLNQYASLESLTVDPFASISAQTTEFIVGSISNEGSIIIELGSELKFASYTGMGVLELNDSMLTLNSNNDSIIENLNSITENTIQIDLLYESNLTFNSISADNLILNAGNGSIEVLSATYSNSNLYASGMVTVVGGNNMQNLETVAGSGKPTNLTITDDATVQKIIIGVDTKFSVANNSTINLNGNWVDNNTSGGFIANDSTINIINDVTVSGKSTFHNVTISPANKMIVASGSAIEISNTFTNNGDFIINDATVTFNLGVVINSGTTFSATNSILNFNNDLTLANNAATLGSNNKYNCFGDVTVNANATIPATNDFILESNFISYSTNVGSLSFLFNGNSDQVFEYPAVYVASDFNVDKSNGTFTCTNGLTVQSTDVTFNATKIIFGDNTFTFADKLTLSCDVLDTTAQINLTTIDFTCATINFSGELSCDEIIFNDLTNFNTNGIINCATITLDGQTNIKSTSLSFKKDTVFGGTSSSVLNVEGPFDMTTYELSFETISANFLASEIFCNGFSVGDSATINFSDDASMTQNITSDFQVLTNGQVNVGSGKFVLGNLAVANGGSFEQTGVNGALIEQSFVSLLANGSVVWDSTSQGGTLIIGGDVTGSEAENVFFNLKNVALSNDAILRGVFYDLIIPASITLTNGSKITVRRNFTIEKTGKYIHNNLEIVFGSHLTNPNFKSALTGNITDNNVLKNNLGSVIVNAGSVVGVEKIFSSEILTNDLTVNNDTTLHVTNFNLTCEGDVINNGTLILGNSIIYFKKDFKLLESSSFTCGTSTLQFDGTVDQNFYAGAKNIYNLNIYKVTGNFFATESFTVLNDSNLNCATLTFGDNESDEFIFEKGITHNIDNAQLNLVGLMQTNNANITVNKINLTGDSVIDTGSNNGSISIASVVGNNNNLKLCSGSDNINVSSDVTSINILTINDITSTGRAIFSGKTNLQELITFGATFSISFLDDVTIQNAVVMNCHNLILGNSESQKFNFKNGFTQNAVSSQLDLVGLMQTNNANITVNKINLTGDSVIDTGSNNGSISIASVVGNNNNLKLCSGSDDINISSDVTSINILTLEEDEITSTGNILFTGNLTATQIITFPQNYKITFLANDNNSGIVNVTGDAITDFKNLGGIQLGDNENDIFNFTNGITHLNDDLIIAGTINVEINDINFSKCELIEHSVINNINGNFILDGKLTGDKNLSISSFINHINGDITVYNLEINSTTTNLNGNIEVNNLNTNSNVILIKDITVLAQDSIELSVGKNINGTVDKMQGLEVTYFDSLEFGTVGSSVQLKFLRINSTSTKDLTLPQVDVDDLQIIASGNVIQSGALKGKNLFVKTKNDLGKNIILENVLNDYDNCIFATRNLSDTLDVVAIISYADLDDVNFSNTAFTEENAGIRTKGKTILNCGLKTSPVIQVGKIITNDLLLLGKGSYKLTNLENNIKNFASDVENEIEIVHIGTMNVSSLQNTSAQSYSGVLCAKIIFGDTSLSSSTLNLEQPIQTSVSDIRFNNNITANTDINVDAENKIIFAPNLQISINGNANFIAKTMEALSNVTFSITQNVLFSCEINVTNVENVSANLIQFEKNNSAEEINLHGNTELVNSVIFTAITTNVHGDIKGELLTVNSDLNFITNEINVDSVLNMKKNINSYVIVNFNNDIIFDCDSDEQKFITNSDLIFGASSDQTITIKNNAKLLIESVSELVSPKIIWKGKTNSINDLTVNNYGLFITYEDADFVFLNNASFKQIGTGDVQVAGSFETTYSSSGQIIFENDIYVYGDGGSDSKIIFGGGTGPLGEYAVIFNKNVFANTTDTDGKKKIVIASPTKINNNFSMFKGTLSFLDTATVVPSLIVGEDLILLNGESSLMYEDSESSVSDLYSYLNTQRNDVVAKPSLQNFPTTLPDGTVIDHDKYFSFIDLITLSSKTIIVGKNFYANGIDFSAVAPWKLQIPNNDLALSAFAEAYNCIFKNTNVICSVPGGHAFVAAGEKCINSGNNSGISFIQTTFKDDFVYTVYDDTIYVEFTNKIENSNNEISKALSNIKFNNGEISFSGAFIDPDCITSTDGKGDLENFYLRTSGFANERWNTDANGLSVGDVSSETKSTDRGRPGEVAQTRNIIPNVEMPKALNNLYECLRDEYKNRVKHYFGESLRYTNVLDKCSPVLVEVFSGQELHYTHDGITETSQKKYDSHNFIELRYSEKVIIGNATDAISENIQESNFFDGNSTFGGKILNNENGISILNYLQIENGKLSTGSKIFGQNVNSLYRTFSLDGKIENEIYQTKRIRFGIASYVDGTITVNGKTFYKWNGYINSNDSVSPSGNVFPIANDNVRDSNGNILDIALPSELLNHKLPQLVLNNSIKAGFVYGSWDLSAPVFSKYLNADKWSDIENWKDVVAHEILGVDTDDDTRVNILEMHFHDNTPTYTSDDVFHWVSKRGWVSKLGTDKQVAKDISGGSRAFIDEGNITEENKTSGGLRFSSLVNSVSAFAYANNTEGYDSTIKKFDETYFSQTVSIDSFFGETTSSPDSDSLYLSLSFLSQDNKLFPLQNCFDLTYDDSQGFITDLAGNKMLSQTLKSIDRTPPKFLFTLAPVDSNKLHLVFTKQLRTKPEDLIEIPNQIELVNKDGSLADVQIDVSVPAFVLKDTKYGTELVLTLTENVQFNDLLSLRVRVKQPQNQTVDPFTGKQAYITKIVDNGVEENYMVHHTAHTLSDFGINVINVLHAYDGRLDDENDDSILSSVSKDGVNFILRDFTGNDSVQGRMLTEKDITVVTTVNEQATKNIIMHIDSFAKNNEPDASEVSSRYNENTNSNSRVWLPTEYKSFTEKAHSGSKTLFHDIAEEQMQRSFTIPNDPNNVNCFNWPKGNDVQFLFEYEDKIDHDADPLTEDVPLYLLRQIDKNDADESRNTEFDLWSFKLEDLSRQRGGTTILNNVINVSNGEETILEVDMHIKGKLIVQVLTLDGNVVKILENKTVETGLHYYKWNGTNKAGSPVSRGIYFIRVVGPGIDETRKVLAIKD